MALIVAGDKVCSACVCICWLLITIPHKCACCVTEMVAAQRSEATMAAEHATMTQALAAATNATQTLGQNLAQARADVSRIQREVCQFLTNIF